MRQRLFSGGSRNWLVTMLLAFVLGLLITNLVIVILTSVGFVLGSFFMARFSSRLPESIWIAVALTRG